MPPPRGRSAGRRAQDLRRGRRGRAHRPRDPAGRVLHDAGPFGLGQDHLPAHDRRLRAARTPGAIELGGEDVTGLPPNERDVNTVFQDYALFPHMSVGQNVEYGLKVKKSARAERRAARRGGARAGAAGGLREAPPGPALRRPAPARRACAGARQPAARAAARRAAGRARPEAAPAAAGRAEADPAGGRDHVHLRHPRPGRGALDERPDRGHGQRPRAPGRLAATRSTTSRDSDFVAGFVGVSNLLELEVESVEDGVATLRLGPAGRRAARAATDPACARADSAIVTIRPERIAIAEGSDAERGRGLPRVGNRPREPLRRARRHASSSSSTEAAS